MAFTNPFRPGAGHQPPHLAGREREINEFIKLLNQDVILDNVIITGLRGVGKTVLMDKLKPIAMSKGWAWVGTDLSESSSLSEENIAIRLLTDLSVFTSNIVLGATETLGFGDNEKKYMCFKQLKQRYMDTPGLTSDKLKNVLEFVWRQSNSPENEHLNSRKVIFAYDEAQNLSDHAETEKFPTSLLLDVFQSIQKQGIPYMLVLGGLPTLLPTLVESRTFSERMFRAIVLERLSEKASRDAITKPVTDSDCPVCLDEASIDAIITQSAGYPYFVQFICREVYDAFIMGTSSVPVSAITQKLDSDFFLGRWARATDRQRDLLEVIAQLDNSEDEFSVQEIANLSKVISEKPFGSSNINQMLTSLSKAGLVYKNRHGRYSFAVPLMSRFILRQSK